MSESVMSESALTTPLLPVLGSIGLRLEALTPSQQIALLETIRSELASEVLKVLLRSTAKAGEADKIALVEMGLAHKKKDSFFAITPRGRYCGGILARALATQLGIPIKTVVDEAQLRRSFQRNVFVSQTTW